MVSAPTGTKKEDLLDPAFWTHVSGQMARLDLIEVIEETLAWRAELIVTSARKLENKTTVVRVEILTYHPLGRNGHQGASESVSNYETKFIESRRWCVIRRHDGEVMVEDLDTQGEAKQWIKNNGADNKKAA